MQTVIHDCPVIYGSIAAVALCIAPIESCVLGLSPSKPPIQPRAGIPAHQREVTRRVVLSKYLLNDKITAELASKGTMTAKKLASALGVTEREIYHVIRPMLRNKDVFRTGRGLNLFQLYQLPVIADNEVRTTVRCSALSSTSAA